MIFFGSSTKLGKLEVGQSAEGIYLRGENVGKGERTFMTKTITTKKLTYTGQSPEKGPHDSPQSIKEKNQAYNIKKLSKSGGQNEKISG